MSDGQPACADLVVIGGGVLGLCVAFEAAKAGRSVVLFEREPDLAARTSANWFRILHGGLRYLQSFDLLRHRESVQARREWLRDFPDFVEPLPCLMPLYGRGLKRPSTFKMAFGLDAALTLGRNKGMRADRHLASGRVLNAAETKRLLPELDANGLCGAALWNDAVAKDAKGLAEALAGRASAAGAVLETSGHVKEILTRDGKVAGVRTLDGRTTMAARVVNTTGPWTDLTLGTLASPARENLFRPSLAFNLILKRQAPFDGALAVQARHQNAPVLFAYPLQDRMFAGTWHVPWHGNPHQPAPSADDLRAMIADLAEAMPWLDLDVTSIEAVHAGLLPVATAGDINLADRPILVDHGREHGLHGLISTAAIKFTTAPMLARRVVASLPA